MDVSDEKTTRARELAHEHFVIREVMKRIESQLERAGAEPSDRSLHWDLLSLLATFRDHLKRHFHLEEAGGLLGEATEYFDEESQRLAADLVAQHRGFERRIERIANRLDVSVRDGSIETIALCECYEGDLHGLLADLSAHERAETGLLERVILGSEGA